KPAQDIGSKDDLYLDSETGDIYKKTADGWIVLANIQGPAGEDGSDGATWIVDKGKPSSQLGKEKDLYLDSTNGKIYEKTASGWEYITTLESCDCTEEESGKEDEEEKEVGTGNANETDNESNKDPNTSSDGNEEEAG